MENNKATALQAGMLIMCLAGAAAAQTPIHEPLPDYAPPRTLHGTPDISGIWQSFTTANWNILSHSVQPGPFAEMTGAWGAGRAGLGIVEGNELPYQDWAAAEQQRNYENRAVVNVTNDPGRFDTGDPELQCFRAGVPRANYMPFPFRIFQTPEQVLIVYEYKGAYRTIHMDEERPAYDENAPLNMQGVVTKVELTNPHSWLWVDVTNEDGTVTNWGFEGGPPVNLFRNGLTRDTLPVGSEIRVFAYRAKSGENKGVAVFFEYLDGSKVFMGGSAPGADGQPRPERDR